MVQEVADTRDDIGKLMDRSRQSQDQNQKSSLLSLCHGLTWHFANAMSGVSFATAMLKVSSPWNDC